MENVVCDLCYYDRKHDKELTPEDVEQLLESGAITLDEIMERIKKVLSENVRMPK